VTAAAHGVGRASFALLSESGWRVVFHGRRNRLFAINAGSAFLATRQAREGLWAAHGSAAPLSSVVGNGGEDGVPVYCASKASMVGFARARVVELGEEVRFNILRSGQTATRLMVWEARRLISSRRSAASRYGALQRRAKSPRPFRFFFCLDRPSSTATSSPSTAGIVGIAFAKPRKVRGKAKGGPIGIGAQRVTTGG
jgi:hypothetical protein